MTPEEAFQSIPDKDAGAFCNCLWRWVHVLDDLYDKDKTPTADEVAYTFLGLLEQIAFNPFFQKHRDRIFPLLHMGATAWAASERMKDSEKLEEKLAAATIKSNYQEVFHFCAFLVGGAQLQQQFDRNTRSYNFS
jgi:hypothetical protein